MPYGGLNNFDGDYDAYREYLYGSTGQFTDPWLNFGGPGQGSTENLNGSLPGGGSGMDFGGFDFGSLFGGGNGLIQPPTNGSGAPGTSPSMPIPNWASGLGGLIPSIIGAITGGGGNNSNGQQAPANGQQAPGTDLMSTLWNRIMGAGGLGLSLYGALDAQNARQWQQGSQIDVLNFLRNAYGAQQGQASAVNGMVLPGLQQILGGGTGQGNQADVQNRLESLYNTLPGMFTQPTDASRIPGLNTFFDMLGGAQGANNRALQTAFGRVEGGQDPSLTQGMNRASQLSQGNPFLSGAGNSLLGSQGENALTQALQGAGMQTLATQGNNPAIDQLRQLSQGMFRDRPELSAANNAATSILSQNPLLPMDQVVGMAVNGAATDAHNRMGTLRQQLLDRTGVTGPAIAGGTQNELLKELGDESLQSVSKARTDALMGQQGLQLQRFGQAGSLLGQSAGASQGYTNQGLQGLTQAIAQAANREQNLPQLGLGGGNLALQRLLGGGSLSSADSNNSTNALGALGSLFNSGTNRQNSDMGSLIQLLTQSGDLNRDRLNSVMGLQNFGQSQATNMSNSLASLLGIQSGNANNQNNFFGQGLGQSNNLLQSWMNSMNNNTQQQSSLFNNSNNVNNAFAQPAQIMSGMGQYRGLGQ